MSKKLSLLAALAAFTIGAAPTPGQSEPPKCEECGEETYGTAVRWAGTPSEAARVAEADEKLVFVLHVSGHFEDPGTT